MSMHVRTGRGTIGGVALAALLVGAWGTPVVAQDSVRVVPVSDWQRNVERLTRELVAQRGRELEFLRRLQFLELRVQQAPDDSSRSVFRAQSQAVFTQLREASSNQLRLRRSLESMCSEVRKPAGWLGVSATGVSLVDKQGVVRYLEPPIVESVDPGSPADRAGIRTGDVLVEMDGQPLVRRDIVLAELLRPGQTLVVKLQRGARTITFSPVIEEMPASLSGTPCPWVDAGTAYVLSPSAPSGAYAGVIKAAPRAGGAGGFAKVKQSGDSGTLTVMTGANPSSYSFNTVTPMPSLFVSSANPAAVQVVAGVQVVPVNEDLGEVVGVNKGLFVLQVLQGTPGREAGIKAGDVLLEANEVELTTASTLTRVISRVASTDRTVKLTVLRSNKKRETVVLKW